MLLECEDGGTTGGRKAQFYDRGEGWGMMCSRLSPGLCNLCTPKFAPRHFWMKPNLGFATWNLCIWDMTVGVCDMAVGLFFCTCGFVHTQMNIGNAPISLCAKFHANRRCSKLTWFFGLASRFIFHRFFCLARLILSLSYQFPHWSYVIYRYIGLKEFLHESTWGTSMGSTYIYRFIGPRGNH